MSVDFSTMYANAKAQAEQRAADRCEAFSGYLTQIREHTSPTDKYNEMRGNRGERTMTEREIALDGLLHNMTGTNSTGEE